MTTTRSRRLYKGLRRALEAKAGLHYFALDRAPSYALGLAAQIEFALMPLFHLRVQRARG